MGLRASPKNISSTVTTLSATVETVSAQASRPAFGARLTSSLMTFVSIRNVIDGIGKDVDSVAALRRLYYILLFAGKFSQFHESLGERCLSAPLPVFKRLESAVGAVLVFSIALLMSLAWAGYTQRSITRPLTRLVESTRRIGRGNWDTPLDSVVLSNTDEVGDLAREYQAMTEQLATTLVSRDELVREVELRRAAETELERNIANLERSNADLEQFANVASHDLQEPLRMVGSYTQLLQKRYGGQLDEKADAYIHFAVDGANRMKTLIQDLLSYSRVTRKTELLARVQLGTVVQTVRHTMRLSIDESGARIEVGELPSVLGDESQLAHLFQNLIGNAIKYRGDQRPVVEVNAKALDETWQVTVRDNGIGIDPQYAEQIFVIFQRLHTKVEYDGTGIGLAICKRIVERHGGRIWVECEPPGCAFHFTLRGAAMRAGAGDVDFLTNNSGPSHRLSAAGMSTSLVDRGAA